MHPAVPIGVESDPDLERRFGGLRRLYGDEGYERVRSLHVVVVGLGGVGSWTCEALARSGVAALTLIDLDHVSESNVNRQIQALESTIGQSKVQALAERIAQIHPGCRVVCIEEFVDADNWPALVDGGQAIHAVVDACDQVRAKRALAAWAIATATPLVAVGAAGGKRKPQAVEADDLARVTHDPLLASLRQQLRKFHGGARTGDMGVRCVFSREPVMQPESAVCLPGEATDNDGSLNCHGYGSTVTVTATFGMVAASEALAAAMTHSPVSRKATLPGPEKISTPDAWTTAFTVI